MLRNLLQFYRQLIWKTLLALLLRFSLVFSKPTTPPYYAKPITTPLPTRPYCKNRKKPQWVVNKVLYLAAISGYGAGKVAELFNQRYGHHGDSVGKTFVYYQMKDQQYQIRVLRRQIKGKPPRTIPINQTWGMDLATVTLNKQQKLVLGIVDHGSRLSIALRELKSKHSDVLLLEICRAIKQFGLPKFIRTDNERCFTSTTFKLALKLLGIRHQTSDIASPWHKIAGANFEHRSTAPMAQRVSNRSLRIKWPYRAVLRIIQREVQTVRFQSLQPANRTGHIPHLVQPNPNPSEFRWANSSRSMARQAEQKCRSSALGQCMAGGVMWLLCARLATTFSQTGKSNVRTECGLPLPEKQEIGL